MVFGRFFELPECPDCPFISRSALIRAISWEAGSYERPSRRASSASVGTNSPRKAFPQTPKGCQVVISQVNAGLSP
jgi:hypothetical protein